MASNTLKTVQEVIDLLLQVPVEYRDRVLYIAESDEYTFSTVKSIRSVDFTGDGMVEDTYKDVGIGEAVYLDTME